MQYYYSLRNICYGIQNKMITAENHFLRRKTIYLLISSILVVGYIVFSSSSAPSCPTQIEKVSKRMECEEVMFPIIDPNDIKDFDKDDTRLLNYLRGRHLTPPSKLPYNFNQARYDPGGDINVIARLKKIFKNKTGGFFVEVGAFDGVGSNTLFFEMVYNWSGLLIECHPTLVPELRRANRKAYIADVCISTSDRPSMTEIISAEDDFNEFPGSSSLKEDFFKRINASTRRFKVQTVPIYSLLAALKVTVVNFIILDVQGIELKVLKKFPFASVLVQVWVVEHTEHTAEEKSEILEIMVKNGYKKYEDLGGDYLFIHDSV